MTRRRAIAAATALAVLTSTLGSSVAAAARPERTGPTVAYRTVQLEPGSHSGERPGADPALRGDGRRLATGGSESAGSQVAAAVTPPLATVSGAPNLQATAGRNGLADVSRGSCAVRPCREPGNPAVAANGNLVVQIVDGFVRVTDRSATLIEQIQTRFLFGWDDEVDATNATVVWDAAHSRWVYTAVVHRYCDASFLVLAIAPAATPLAFSGGLTLLQPGIVYDDPWLGISSDKLVVGSNQFAVDPSTCAFIEYLGAGLHIVDWADLLDADPETHVAETAPDAGLFAWRPARNLSSSPTVRAVVGVLPSAASAPLRPAVSAITGSVMAETVAVAAPTDLVAAGKLVAMAMVPDPYQAGAVRRITAPLDERPLDAIARDGSLFFTQQVRCRPPGDTVDRACSRVVEYVPATGVVRQDFLLGGLGKDTYMPAMTFAANGRMFIAYTQSSTATYPTPFVTTRDPADPVDTVRTPAQFAVSGAGYAGSRWGEAIVMAPDTLVTTQVWASLPYVDPSGGWALWTSRLWRQTGPLSGGSVTIAGGTAVNTSKVSLSIVAPPTGPVTLIRISNVPTTSNGVLSKSRMYTARRSISWSFFDSFTGGTGAQGTRTVYLQFGDGAGGWGPVVSDSILFETTPPTAPGAPFADPVVPSAIVSFDVPDRLAWPVATDAGSGVASYQIEVSSSLSGPWEALPDTPVVSAGIARSTTDISHLDGAYRVRAVDHAGNVGPWTAAFAISRYQCCDAMTFAPQPNPVGEDQLWTSQCSTCAFGGPWLFRPDPEADGGSVTWAAIAGGEERRGLGVVASTCPECGTMEIVLDGEVVATVDLYSPEAAHERLVWAQLFETPAAHTLLVRAAGPGVGSGHGVPIGGYIYVSAPFPD